GEPKPGARSSNSDCTWSTSTACPVRSRTTGVRGGRCHRGRRDRVSKATSSSLDFASRPPDGWRGEEALPDWIGTTTSWQAEERHRRLRTDNELSQTWQTASWVEVRTHPCKTWASPRCMGL